MKLKKKITKAEYDALSKTLQELYSLGESEDEYILDTDDAGEDNGALKRALDRERQAAKDAKKKASELEAAQQLLEEDAARKAGDVAKIEDGWKKKLEKINTEHATALEQANAALRSLLVDAKATELAAKIATAPALLIPHIKARLKADIVDGKPVTVVLDENGAPSTMTLEQLEKFFTNSKDYAPIIIGSKASGAGSGGHRSGSGALNKKPSEYTETERTELYRADPAEFQRVFGSR
jgi:hypothetical protein